MLTIRRHPDAGEPARLPGAIRLDAESAWVVEGSAEEVSAVVGDLGTGVCERLAEGVALLRFGNSVGRIERAGALGTLVIHSGKWSEQDYDRLLEDLARITAALPFAPVAASSLPYERTELDAPDVLYHAFVWLRHALLRDYDSELHDALEAILRVPHRRLVRTSREVSVELAGRLGSQTLKDVASGRWPIIEDDHGFLVGGRRVLPLRVDEDIARESADTAENRFVKSFLDECAWVVDRARRHLGQGDGVVARRVRRDCERLTGIVGTWRRASLWREVGSMEHFPATSSVLHRRSEYRAVLRHHLMLRLGSRVPLDADATARLLESKDIATLYELWATFAVLDEMSVLLGLPVETNRVVVDHGAASVAWGLVARWERGTALAYNHTYTRTRGFHGTSRSSRLRPDIALFVPGGPSAGLHLFDAKFRLDGTLDPEADDETSYKRSDLHKMHAYRDAIPAARSAWVLYPGAEDAAFFDDGRRGLEDVASGSVVGVGALTVRPDGARGALRAMLKAMLIPSEALAGAQRGDWRTSQRGARWP